MDPFSETPSSSVSPALFQTVGLCKSYRTGMHALVEGLTDISLEIAEPSYIAFTGPSGSGKSTLLAMLSGLDRPSSGTVSFRGLDLTRCSDVELARVRRQLGFVFQDFALIPSLPAWENVTYPLVPRGIPRGERYEIALTALARLGVRDTWMKRPGQLSGGEQQRVAVARALAGDPDVLIADEPTSNLDAASGEALLSLLSSMRQSGKSVIVSSHDARILDLADKVYQLRAGRLVA